MSTDKFPHRVGWIGTGRMGSAIATRLLDAGVDLWVWNRTRSKAEALEVKGAKVVDTPAELAERDIVFTMVGGPKDVLEVTFGENGVMSNPGSRPSIIIDSTTIDPMTSQDLTARGDEARLVKIAHNLMLGVVTQSMAEITLLCEKAGVKRSDFLEFLNDSVMGSTFTRYKTPAFVNLDYTPTFTSHLLRKDLELGLEASRHTDVPLPLTALTHQIVMENIGLGQGDADFANLLSRHAAASGMEIVPEGIDVPTGLE